MKLPSRVVSVIAELRRRRVLQASALYATVAFIAVQVVAIAFPALRLPEWSQTVVVVLALLGFPVVVAISWAFELTPEGFRRTVEEGGEAEVVHARGTPWVSLTLVAIVTLMSAGIGWVAWDVWLRPLPGADAEAASEASRESLSPTRVAVLPFRYRSRSEVEASATRRSHIAEGLTADLIHELSQVPALDVVSERGTRPYQGRDVPLDSVARALRAGSIVEGTVEATSDSIRVTVQLVDGETSRYLMSHQRVRSRDSLLALRDAVVGGATRQLRRQLGEEVRLEGHRAGTRSDRAWELFHRAEQLKDEGDDLRFSGETDLAERLYRRADSLYREAERLDDRWVDPTVARGWLAYARARLGSERITAMKPDRLRRGIDHADRVLRRRPAHAPALELRGTLLSALAKVSDSGARDSLQARAEEDLRGAIAADPNRAKAWGELSDLVRSQGRFEEAQVAARKSREADQFLAHDGDNVFLSAHMALEVGAFGESLDLVRRGERLYPKDFRWAGLRLLLYATAGGPPAPPDSVWAAVRRFESLFPASRGESPMARMQVAAALARADLEDSARSVLRSVREDAYEQGRAYAMPYEANVWLNLGDTGRTLELLRAYLDTLPSERSYVANDVWWWTLHDDSAFRALVSAEE